MSLRRNDLEIRNLGVGCALNPWAANDSSSRQVMFSNHAGQTLVTNGATVRYNLTGAEIEYADATFKVEFPCAARILKVIKKYKGGITLGSIDAKHNPETIVIYENLDVAQQGGVELGVVVIPAYHSTHQKFGFKFKPTRFSEMLAANEIIPAGTIVAQSPNVTESGIWKYGRESNVVLLSIPQCIEDGIVISRSFAEANKITSIETHMLSWGKRSFPLNIYGSEDIYKILPEVGETVREDRLLFALREYDERLACVDMTNEALREPDLIHDSLVYVPAGSKIVDIKIMCANSNQTFTADEMLTQPRRYADAQMRFYTEILETVQEFERRRKIRNAPMTPALHRLMVETIREVKQIPTNAISTYRAVPLDEWSLEVTIATTITPDVGFKFTDCHGGKGVVVEVWPDEDMPIDAFGNRADVIMDGDSTVKRMNIGRVYEQYLNATGRMVANNLRDMAAKATPTEEMWQYLTSYYTIASPLYLEEDIRALEHEINFKENHLRTVMQSPVVPLRLPPNSPNIGDVQIHDLMQYFPIEISPITYRGNSGNIVTTHDCHLIASMYVIMLEKIGADWAAISTAKRQHFGLLAKLTNADKNSRPWRGQSVRMVGEAEARLISAYSGDQITAELLEIPNSPAATQEIVRTIIQAKQPTNIPRVLDRTRVPKGSSRAVNFVKHILGCAGFMFERG